MRIYSWIVALVGWGLLLPLLYLAPVPPLQFVGFLIILAIVTEGLMVPLPRGGYLSAGPVAVSVALATVGPVYTALLMCIGVVVGNGVAHRRPPLTTVFNSGVYILAPLAAGVVFEILHPADASLFTPLFGGRTDPLFLASFLTAVVAYASVSGVLVSGRVALRRRIPYVAVLTTNIVWELVITLVFATFGLIVVLIERNALPSVVIVLSVPLLAAAYIMMLHMTREHAHQELATVERIGRALMTLDPEEQFQTIYTEISRIMAADAFYVALYDAPHHLLTYEFLIDNGERFPRHTRTVSPAIRKILENRTPLRLSLRPGEAGRDDPVNPNGKVERRSASLMYVPIAKGNQVIGLLSVQSYSHVDYTERDLGLLEAVATQAATAIENGHLYDEAKRARDELTVLYEAVKTISSSSLELQAVLDSLVQVTCRAFTYEYGAIFLVDERTEEMEVRATFGYSPQIRGTRVPAGKGVSGWVQRTGEAAIVPNVHEDPRYIGFNDVIASEVAVPLIMKGKVIGVFNVESTRLDAFRPRDVKILSALAGYAIIAIENARLFEQTKLLAITDGLTELYNHRHFYEALDRTLERCNHDGQPLALIMLEIDNFKWYNDTYGHRQGDEVLRTVADLLRKGSRPSDLVARYGGDEFMIILPNNSKDAAHEIAERTRRMVEAYPFMLGDNFMTSVTLSVGVAATPEDGASVEAIIEAVDRAQYAAKHSGGNKVHLAQVSQ